MLCRIFLKLAGMSVTAGVLVLAILAVRALTRRRMPKWAHCLLWGLVAACLLCPVLPESGLSLRPQSGELVQYGDQLTGLGPGAGHHPDGNRSAGCLRFPNG